MKPPTGKGECHNAGWPILYESKGWGRDDEMAETQVTYEYDIDQTALYGTANNRLMTADTTDISACDPLVSSCPIISTNYYLYNFAGNVVRVVTETANPPSGEPVFKAMRYVYARNAQTVSYVLGETWNPDSPDPDPDPDDYTVTFAREFRYDGARQRYLDRELDPAGLMATPQTFDVLSETWTDYDGDNTYADFTVTAGVVTNGTGHELGTAQINRSTPTTFDTLYAHNDHLGTLRAQSNSTGFTSFPVHTAFGEDRTGQGQRYAYAANSPQRFVDPNGLNIVGNFFIGGGALLGTAGATLYLSNPSPKGLVISQTLRALGTVSCGIGAFINFIAKPPTYIRLPSRPGPPPITDRLGPSGISLLPRGSIT